MKSSALANSNDEKSSPFDFLKHLEGCHKGDKLKGIHELKAYLEHFGHWILGFPNCVQDDDASMWGARHRQWHHSDDFRQEKPTHSSTSFHTVSHYTFFRGSPKWPASKYSLTYGFLPRTPSRAMDPVARAFQTWAANTHFRFARVQDYTTADIKIGFHRANHGDGNSFDGRGGILAHAFAPQDGRFHYDADETWAVGATQGAYDLETVALHEIGHLLGLGHSSVEGAIMFASISSGSTKGLHSDDIQGIRALYNV
ncbi:hypothetical protein GH714_041520 [Hevea brasiliensis]|uniref:Peptidase metallopeptidase domain-containing protein n=1 Tax=Hevea brasiliensis TaxID=3981 RepID=A0A6A6MW40_HEVBR|nr:hypothetical protein GH714_041520 [Hevea brasiliensis]